MRSRFAPSHLAQWMGALGVVLAACSSSDEAAGPDASSATGGATVGSGGSASTGGSGGSVPSSGTGGATAGGGGATANTGGSSTIATGGSANGGGAVATGGATSAGGDGGDGGGTDGTCIREALQAQVTAYFTALAAHDAKGLPLSSSVKFTENGKKLAVGEGLWKTAGAVKFHITAIDTEACSTVTESVVPDGSTDIPFGLRLKLAAGQISEIETIAVRSGDYFTPSNTEAMEATKPADWETVLDATQKTPRADLEKIIDDYFERFPVGACNFASDCRRLENGFSPGVCVDGSVVKCSPTGSGTLAMKPRLVLIDVDTGIAVGVVMFAGSYTDFHLFQAKAGKVHGVHAVLASASSSGWE